MITYQGVCNCCGVVQTGPVSSARSDPYWLTDVVTGKRQKVLLIINERGQAHDIPWHSAVVST